MIFAFGRLILIALFSIMCIFLAVFGLRSIGTNQAYSNFTHPLIDGGTWLIAEGGDLDYGPAQSLSALRAAAQLNENIFLGLKIRTTLDGQWVLYAPSKLETLSTGEGYVLQKNLEEILALQFKSSPKEHLLALATVFKEFPNARYFIEVVQPGGTQLKALYSLIKEYKLEKRIVLTSQFQDTVTELRKESAQWLTGASTSETSKSEFMNSIFLETMVALNYDVFVAQKKIPRLIAELQRRKKIVLFSIDDRSELLDAALLNTDAGVLTTRPSYFMQKVDSKALSH